MLHCRVNFYKDLASTNGRSFGCLQQSVLIRKARSLDRAIEAAKRRFERHCRVSTWSLYADRLEMEFEGKKISYAPKHNELDPGAFPGRIGLSRDASSGRCAKAHRRQYPFWPPLCTSLR